MPLRSNHLQKPSPSHWRASAGKRGKSLTVNMISLPLGDFRHMSHIGNRNHRESFGDLSFLQGGRSLLLHSSHSEQNLFLACSGPPKPPRANHNQSDASEDIENSRTRRQKKCSSLPLLDCEEDEVLQAEEGCTITDNSLPSPDKSKSDMDNLAGFSLDLDLGPSFLDDVLRVMDNFHQ